MFERGIGAGQVRAVVESGEVIAQYPEDSPFPSVLVLGFLGETPLHVVLGEDVAERTCIVITVYVPQAGLWDTDFKNRKRV